jgi:death on curing protein
VSKLLTHLTPSAVKAIHAEVLAAHGGSPGLRGENLLESAIAAPQATMMGRRLISDPIEIAAAYLFYLCRNRPFIDGNERTALASCLVFLETNGLLPFEKLTREDWEPFVLDVAAGRLDRNRTTARSQKLLKRKKSRQHSLRLSRRPSARQRSVEALKRLGGEKTSQLG